MTRKMLIKAHEALPMSVMPASSWGAPSFLSKEDFASAGGPPDFATPTLLHCFAGHSALRLTHVLQNVQNYFPLLSIVPVKENKKVRFGMFQVSAIFPSSLQVAHRRTCSAMDRQARRGRSTKRFQDMQLSGHDGKPIQS